MIKFFFMLLFLSISSIAIGSWLTTDPGYILIIFHHWQLQTSLVIFGLILSSLLLLIYIGQQLILTYFKLPKKIEQFVRQWQTKTSLQQQDRGIQAWFQKNWALALQLFQKQTTQQTWYSNLLAAQTAQYQNQLQTRDHFLNFALQQAPHAKNTIILFQANLQIQQQQFEQAQATLNQASKSIRTTSAYWLMLQTAIDQHHQLYQKILERLYTYRKILNTQDLYLYYYKEALLNTIKQESQLKTNLQRFKHAPLVLQQDLEILNVFAPKAGEHQYLQKIILSLVKQEPNEPLLLLILKLKSPKFWLVQLEQLLPQQTNNFMLFYVLGVLKAKLQLWGNAITYLQHSIQIKPNPYAYTELARIYLEQQQHQLALSTMQQALNIN